VNPTDFHTLAQTLLKKQGAAECRTAISRAYYAAHHVAVRLLTKRIGASIGQGTNAHGNAMNCLSNSGDTEVMRLGNQLGDLYSKRIRADYYLDRTDVENLGTAAGYVEQARRMIEALELCSRDGERLDRMRETIRAAPATKHLLRG
jgi:uncharacterized protein (UPF0332 family)